MLGFDISWAGFNIIEVMSSSKFTYKRIGYLAASQCFHQDTEVCLYLYFYGMQSINIFIFSQNKIIIFSKFHCCLKVFIIMIFKSLAM